MIEQAGMAGALGMDTLGLRLLECEHRAERAMLVAMLVKAREARKLLDTEQAIRTLGGDPDGG